MQEKLPQSTLGIFWHHAKRHLVLLWPGLFSVFVASILEIIKPIYYKDFFDLLSGGVINAPLLIGIIYKILIVLLVTWFFWRIATYTLAAFEAKTMADLANSCFAFLHQHSFSFFSNNFAGSLARKVSKYTRSFEQISDQLFWSLLNTLIRIVFVCGIITLRSRLLGLTMFGWSVFYLGFNYWYALRRMKYDIAKSEMDTLIMGVLADTITNNINIKMFASQGLENKSFKKTVGDWYRATTKAWREHNFNEAIQSLLMVFLEFFVFYFAVKFWQKGVITIGDFAMIQAYLLQLFNRLWDFGRNVRRIYEGFADAKEMTDIFNTPYEVADKPGAKGLKITSGQLVFANADFAYKNHKPIFKNFSFNIRAKEKVAIIGPSGGGKTTIIKLLLRFYDLNRGEILIDGQNISSVTQDSLRSKISLVPQEPVLFHRTLLENIRYGRPEVSESEVVAAAKLAHAHEFISRFPLGYNTFVGERGIKLSGGERQRVAIARAILKNAPILVLDEATSSLDSESEHYIQDALKNLMKDKTVVVIAHRLSTIMQMDRIVVLENGRITEEGKHKELLKMKQGTYQKLWGIQAGGFA